MSSPSYTQLLPLSKARQLSTLLKSIGVKTTGRKPELITRFLQEVQRQRLRSGLTRVLSIDMGVKNLAYCVCDVEVPPTPSPRRLQPHQNKATEQVGHARLADRPLIDVKQWEVVSLFNEPATRTQKGVKAHIRELKATSETVQLDGDVSGEVLYSPSNMARAASRLVDQVWLPSNPSHVLIERQRFRSGGMAAVQEWTLRVNMLESMLHALFVAAAARTETDCYALAVESVSPATVAKYWLEASPEPVSRGRTALRKAPKVVKQEKVGLVKSWVQTPARAPFELTFDGAAERVQRLFASTQPKKPDTASKLDDLADCLLQAATWVQWEQNRRVILDADLTSEKDIESLLDRLAQKTGKFG